MNQTSQIAKQLRDVYFGGNWTGVNLKATLTDISREQATTRLYSFNTIAALVFHINYYVDAMLKVLQGGPLDAHDRYSFDHPPVLTDEDWEKLLTKTWLDAESLIRQIEQLPEQKLWDDFSDRKYGSYYRNLHGVIEHIHYHLGQIVFLKKMFGQTVKRQSLPTGH
jgi:uncharacterized damage-inducible protein DinB